MGLVEAKEMGTGVSIERSRAEINKLRERELNTKVSRSFSSSD